MPRASANVVTLGQSNQNVTFTGIGGTASGAGQSGVAWGACVFDGTNTACTVSGPFTGIGSGGAYNLVFSYRGNGPTPLIAVSTVPGGNSISFSLAPGSSGSFVLSLVENNGPTITFNSPGFTFNFASSACTGVSASFCSVGQVGLTMNATISGSVVGSFDATPVIRGVISASDFGGFTSIAPASWIEIYGTNLATTQRQLWGGADFNGNLAPTALGGTTVTIGGQAAFIDFVTPGQVNVQVPSGVAPGRQPVVVTTVGGSSIGTPVTVNVVEPGLLAPAVFQFGAGQYAVALFPDGVTYVLPPGLQSAAPARRARPGDTIMFYGIGFGTVMPNIPAGQIVQQANALQMPFQISFAGVPATVQYAGLVATYVGLYQFNVVVPSVASSDAVPVTFTLGGASGLQQTLLIPVMD
jgi:uncharacterized protein (TIGR03437 family)